MDKQPCINQHSNFELIETDSLIDYIEQYYPPKTEVIELASDKVMGVCNPVPESGCGLLVS